MTERLFDSEPVWKAPFSPGPWNTDGLEVWTESDLCWGGPICAVIDDYPRGFNRPQQNMRLVAAAPDLYLAVESYLEAVETRDLDAQNEALKAMHTALDRARLGERGRGEG
jgi:hypothetical protein